MVRKQPSPKGKVYDCPYGFIRKGRAFCGIFRKLSPWNRGNTLDGAARDRYNKSKGVIP